MARTKKRTSRDSSLPRNPRDSSLPRNPRDSSLSRSQRSSSVPPPSKGKIGLSSINVVSLCVAFLGLGIFGGYVAFSYLHDTRCLNVQLQQLLNSNLAHSLASTGRLNELKLIIETNSELKLVDLQDPNGWTPLHEAARAGHVEVMEYLLEQGADINALSHGGDTPLLLAAQFLGADSTTVRFLESKIAMSSKEEEAMEEELIEEEPEVEEEVEISPTLPHTLAARGELEELKILAERKQDILHIPDENRWLPLHEAARAGHVEVAEFLLQSGASLNVQTAAGETPLDCAEQGQGPNSPIYQYLKSLGGVNLSGSEPEL